MAGGCHPCRRVRRLALLVRLRPDGLPPRRQALRGARLPAALQRGALRGGVQPPAGVPRRAAGRELPGGYAASDGAALHFVGEDLHRVVLSRPQARAYRVEAVGDEVVGAPAGGRPISASGRRSHLPPPKRPPTILAMGGGGFTMEPDNPALDDYVLVARRRATLPRICLLPTASGDGEAQIRQFHATFGARACEPMHISLFRLGSPPDPAARDAARRRTSSTSAAARCSACSRSGARSGST